MGERGRVLAAVSAVGFLGILWGAPAQAQFAQVPLAGEYYKVPASSNPDFGRGIDWGRVAGLVEPVLGPHGWPVASAYGRNYSGPSGRITDINSDGEIRWWSTTSVGNISLEKMRSDTTPYYFDNFYPDGYSNDYSYYRTAHWHGTFTLGGPSDVLMTVGSDDDTFIFMDNRLVLDYGGTHWHMPWSETLSQVSAGTHTLDLFYADRQQANATMHFELTLPEPGGLAMIGMALLAVCRRQRRAGISGGRARRVLE